MHEENIKDNIDVVAINAADSRVIWEWRNYPEVRENSFNQKEITWEDHHAWFLRKIKDKSVKIYIVKYENQKIGVIRFESGETDIEVSVNLNPAFIGQGLGGIVIQYGTETFAKEATVEKTVIAHIKKDNVRSQKAFEKAGYRLLRVANEEVIYSFNNM